MERNVLRNLNHEGQQQLEPLVHQHQQHEENILIGRTALMAFALVGCQAIFFFVVPVILEKSTTVSPSTYSIVSCLVGCLVFSLVISMLFYFDDGHKPAPRRPSASFTSTLRISRRNFERIDPELLAILLSSRDFTAEDYERLLGLDALSEGEPEPKPAQGASDYEISQLPIVPVSESMLKTTDEGTHCSICLARFEVDTPVRLMPCLHRFHPGCLDAWLHRQATCPICKHPAIA